MPNYQKGKIYCIKNHDLKNIYYGSTTQDIEIRFSQHKSNAIKNNYKRCSSHLCFQTNNYECIILQEVCCENKIELWAIEREYIEKHDNSEYKIINTAIPNQTAKEYYEKNKKYLNEKRKARYYKHHEQEKERVRNYYHKVKEKTLKSFECDICGGKISHHHSARHIRSKKHQSALKRLQKIQEIKNAHNN